MHRTLSSKKFFTLKTIFAVLILTFGVLGILFYVSIFFKIKTIEIKSDKMYTIINGLELYRNEHILLLNEKDLIKTILIYNPNIESATIQKKLPDTLLITIKTYEPCAYLKTNNGFFLLASDGRILSKTKEMKQRAPLINFYEKIDYSFYSPGNIIDFKDLLVALHFVKTVQKLDMTVDTIDITGSHVIGLLIGEKTVNFSSEKDIAVQDYQFEKIAKQFHIEGTNFLKLDLRFDKPIIELAN